MEDISSSRILSLLPGATEVVCRLGRDDQLVGRSHECDYPPAVRQLPACTEPKYEIQFDSAATDQRIRDLIREGLSVYRVDEQQLERLQPDLIITQDHCEACAVPYQEIADSVEKLLDKPVQILNFGPTNLSDLYQHIQEISRALDVPVNGNELVEEMKQEFNQIRKEAGGLESPSVVLLEWLDPLMSSGNWLPELITTAGGDIQLAQPGAHAETIEMEDLLAADPDVLILAPCGYDLGETARHLSEMTQRERWNQLSAVQQERVYLVDANQYFNRPGPRLPRSARIAAECLHPDSFEPQLHGDGWITLDEATSLI